MTVLLLLLAKERANQGGSSRPKQQEQRVLVVVLHDLSFCPSKNGAAHWTNVEQRAQLGTVRRVAATAPQPAAAAKQR
jgi:hypothetical protein